MCCKTTHKLKSEKNQIPTVREYKWSILKLKKEKQTNVVT